MALILALTGLASLVGVGPSVGITAFPANVAYAAAVCPEPLGIVNGGFEQPGYGIVDQSTVPGWRTTATDGAIEIWASGAQGFIADSGSQFVELNAYQVSTLYQDLDTSTLGGKTLNWSFAHRGRQGVDVLQLQIGPVGGPLTVIQTASDGTAAWGHYSGTYTVPEGQDETRFAFASVSSVGGDAIGNFLDSIVFSTPDCSPALSIEKTSDLVDGEPVTVGQTVTFTYTATNVGNVDLENIVVADDQPGLSAITPTNDPLLEIDDAAEFTATYTITQEDLDRGYIESSAGVTADAPEGYTDGAPSAQTNPRFPLTQSPALTFEKTSDIADGATVAVGDVITYTFDVENSGNVTVNDVTISDELAGLTWVDGPNLGDLAPGASATGSATYTVTQGDVDAGTVVNSASATGSPAGGTLAPAVSRITVDAETASPELSFIKTTDLAEGATVAVGDVITYTFTVENTGNVTIADATVSDALAGLTWVTGPSVGTLAPGETGVATATYAVTQADIDAGQIENNASVAGAAARGELAPGTSGVTVPAEPANPSLAFSKTSDVAEGTTVGVGDLITYTFTVTNDGNITISGISVGDELSGLVWQSGPEIGTLAPGETGVATATYVVTQADVDNGGVQNTATLTAQTPRDLPFEAPTSTADVVTDAANPGLSFTKTSDIAEGDTVAVGDVITYTFATENVGNVTISGVTVSDELAGLTWVTGPELGDLAPGETATGSATYTVTQADVDNGGVTNVASVTGAAPEGVEAPNTSAQLEVPTDPKAPTLTLTKTADVADGSTVSVGDVITYTFTAVNTGNVTISDIVVSDALAGLAWVSGPEIGTLAPGETGSASATYTVTQADQDAGSIHNAASVTGSAPGLTEPVNADASLDIATDPGAIGLTLQKTVDPALTVEEGQTVTFTFTATNIGNVTISDVTVSDDFAGLSWISGPAIGTLAPGETGVASASYVVTADDVAAGVVANTATITGIGPAGETYTATDGTQVRACATGQGVTSDPTEAAPTIEGEAADAEITGAAATPIVVTPEPTVALTECALLPEPTDVPQPTQPAGPGPAPTKVPSTGGGSSTGGGASSGGGAAAPVVNALPKTGQGAQTAGDLTGVIGLAAAATLVLAIGLTFVSRRRRA